MYWIICIEGYEVDGHVFKKGWMNQMSKKARGFHERYWRVATKEEVEDKKWFKGQWYNLDNV